MVLCIIFSNFGSHFKNIIYMTFPRVKFNLFLIPVFAVSLFVISCQDSKESTKEVIETVPEVSLEQKRQQLQNVVPSNANSNSATGMTGANPPHGQPGHRCDIAVGAPLDGSSAVKAAPTQSSPVQIQSNSVMGKTGEGLNPPHGQPGHRCDIKVGDPL